MPHDHPKKLQHCDKVNTSTSREISNGDVVLFVIRKNIVNLFIPRWKDINNGENNALEK
jgi:hypothetical protein